MCVCAVWCCTSDFPAEKMELISRLFGSIGDEIYMEDERFLDMATAISGYLSLSLSLSRSLSSRTHTHTSVSVLKIRTQNVQIAHL
jgi:hypothetical protein